MSNPQTTIYLCSGVRLNNDYQHTIWFGSQTEQLNYFSSKVKKTLTNYTYVRKSWTLKVEATMETARTWNYLYFRNGSGKYYFYFINNIEYINDNTVELFIEMDVMQTYLTDYHLSECFVEREHSATDEVGDNIIEEGLEVGEIDTYSVEEITDLNSMCILILSTLNLVATTEETKVTALGGMYDNVYCGMSVYACNVSDALKLSEKIVELDTWGYSECIFNIWMYPKSLVQLAPGYTWESTSLLKHVYQTTPIEYAISRNTQLKKSYTPKNKKLLTHPYNFLYVSNNVGGCAVFKYEYFTNPETVTFRISGSISPEGATKLMPTAYKCGFMENVEEGLSGAPYPCCAWNSDTYKLWLAQNQNAQKMGYVSSGVSMVGGVISMATGNVIGGAGMVVGGMVNIANTIAQKKDMEVQPPQAKGNHSGSVNLANGFPLFTIYRKCIDTERAKIIDDFFTMFGYKTLRVKVPNRKVRESFTYTKTQNCHATGNLCTDDLRKIESIYNNGVTFWVNGDSIGNYTLSNNCL